MSDRAQVIEAWNIVLREWSRIPDHERHGAVGPQITQAQAREQLGRYTFDEASPLRTVAEEVCALLRAGTLHATHPRYFGLFVPGVHESGVLADALVAIFNPQLGAAWHAPAATAIEEHTLRYLSGIIGVDAAAAHFTAGASEGNVTAVLAAICAAFPEFITKGATHAARRGAVYLSSEAHHSLHKAVRVTGLGADALRLIECDDSGAMDVEALALRMGEDVRAGRRPIMVIATLGTTASGACDDIEAVGTVARGQSTWLHVDAAWGGTAAFSPALRELTRGIRHADSLVWDAHKWLSVPMGAGMFFSRHRGLLEKLFAVDATYLPHNPDERAPLYASSLQWSRRFIGLKVFLTLATLGQDRVAARIERQLEVAAYLRRRLCDGGWRIVNNTPLPLVLFDRPGAHVTDMARVGDIVASRGRAWLSVVDRPRGPALRACITHDQTSRTDVDVLCEELDRAIGQLSRPADGPSASYRNPEQPTSLP